MAFNSQDSLRPENEVFHVNQREVGVARAHHLVSSAGVAEYGIAAQVGVGRVQVSRWRGRYAQSRLAGIESNLPRGAPPVKVDVPRLVKLTTESKPKAATHWSTRTMAAELGVSAASVSRHWRAKGL